MEQQWSSNTTIRFSERANITPYAKYTGVGAWSKEARHRAVEAGYEAALILAQTADLTNAVIAALIRARFELPAFSTLERITKHVRALAHRKLCRKVFDGLTAQERKELDQLLVIAVAQA